MPNLNHFRDFTYVVGIDIAKSVFQVHTQHADRRDPKRADQASQVA